MPEVSPPPCDLLLPLPESAPSSFPIEPGSSCLGAAAVTVRSLLGSRGLCFSGPGHSPPSSRALSPLPGEAGAPVPHSPNLPALGPCGKPLGWRERCPFRPRPRCSHPCQSLGPYVRPLDLACGSGPFRLITVLTDLRSHARCLALGTTRGISIALLPTSQAYPRILIPSAQEKLLNEKISVAHGNSACKNDRTPAEIVTAQAAQTGPPLLLTRPGTHI